MAGQMIFDFLGGQFLPSIFNVNQRHSTVGYLSDHIQSAFNVNQRHSTENDKLIQLDDTNQLKESMRSDSVEKAVMKTMKGLVNEIGKIEPQLAGRLVPAGSFYNGTKLFKPDEFDYVLELNLHTLSGGKLRWCPVEEHNKDIFVEFISQASRSNVNSRITKDFFNIEYALKHKTKISEILNPEKVLTCIGNVINNVMSKKKPSKPLTHSGLRSAMYQGRKFNGIHRNRAGYLFQFNFDIRDDPLKISVDFTVVLKVPITSIPKNECKLDRVLDYAVHHVARGLSDTWLLMADTRGLPLSHTIAEDTILRDFDVNSPPKRAIRICKILSQRHLPVSKEDVEKSSYVGYILQRTGTPADEVDKLRQNTSEFFSKSTKEIQLYDLFQEEGEKFSDWDENIGEMSFFPSYLFKSITVNLILADPDHGKKWKSLHVIGLVEKIFKAIDRQISRLDLQVDSARSRSDVDVLGSFLQRLFPRRSKFAFVDNILDTTLFHPKTLQQKSSCLLEVIHAT